MTLDALRTTGTDRRLVLTFHAADAEADQFHGAAEQFLPGAHVVSPQGDVAGDGERRFFRSDADEDDLARRSEAMAGFVAAEIARTGASQVFGLGYADGADILTAVAFRAPDLFHALVLLHPLVPRMPAPEVGLAMTRVLITAGRQDSTCPPDRIQALADLLAMHKADVTLAWHPGGREIPQSEVGAVSRFLT